MRYIIDGPHRLVTGEVISSILWYLPNGTYIVGMDDHGVRQVLGWNVQTGDSVHVHEVTF